MKRRAKQVTSDAVDEGKPNASPVEPEPRLADELKDVLRAVGSENYGVATAREFAVGKYSPRRQRRRYAQM